jgi:hypothetical protein
VNQVALDPGSPTGPDTADLEAAGRLVEAIDVLTEANRRSPDPRLEERLVKLRHAAFETLDRRPGRESWPPTYPDPFPEAVGRPPEIDVSDLDADTLGGGITNHGCLLVRGLLSDEWTQRLTADIDRAIDAYDQGTSGTPVDETTPWFVPFEPNPPYNVGAARNWVRQGGGVWTVDSPRALFDLLEAFDEAGVGEAITGYLGERPAISVKKSTLRRVPVETGTDWHQDGAFLGEGIRTVNVWVSLSDCGVDAPGLDIVPRRMGLAETGTHGAIFDWSVGPGMVDIVAEGAPVMRPVFAPGDALLFDELFLHRTGVSPGMTKTRYAIESWFFAPSTYPDAQVPLAF